MKSKLTFGKFTINIDYGLVLILLLFGLVSCFALYNAFNLVRSGAGPSNMRKQILFYCIGFFLMFYLASQGNEKVFKYINAAYLFLMAALVYLLISKFTERYLHTALPFTHSVNGASSWFNLPFFSFQPSEFIKIVLIVQVSKVVTEFQSFNKKPGWKAEWSLIFRIAKYALPPLLLILIQPDTGVAMIIGFTLAMEVLLSGALRPKWLYVIFGAVAIVIVLFFYLYFFDIDFLKSLITGYRFQRIEAWLEPDSHILGSSNQLYTALLSLGSAGLTGYGMQASIISIPEAHTDFIFAAIGQCFGLAGTTVILLLSLLLDWYLVRMISKVATRQDKLILIGILSMLCFQQLENMGMIVGLFPITGITLPLISYGGSSTISYFIAFGIVMNMQYKEKKPAVAKADKPKAVRKRAQRTAQTA